MLKGKTSRKKEIYPAITKTINELPKYEGLSSTGSLGGFSSSNNKIW